MRFSKTDLIALVPLILVLPWWSGGKEPAAQLIGYFIIFLGLFLLWRSPQKEGIGRSLLGAGMLGLIGLGTLSLLWSVNHYQTAVWAIQLSMVAAAFMLAHQIADKPNQVNNWLRGYLVAAAGFSLYGIWLFLVGSYDRVTSSFYWANPFAGWLLPAIIIAGWRFAKTKRPSDGILALISLTAFILTQSRGAFLVLGLVAVIMLATRQSLQFWARILLVAVSAIILSRGIIIARAQLTHRGTASEASRFKEALQGESQSLTDRANYLRSSVEIWRRYPLAGSGAGTFSSLYPQYQLEVVSAVTNAHNVYIQTAAELGLLGIIGLVILLGGLAQGVMGRLRRQPELVPVVLGLLALLLHMGLDIDASYPAVMFLAAALAGLSWANSRPDGKSWAGLALAVILVLGLPVVSSYQSQLSAQRGQWAQEDHDFALSAQHYKAAHSGLLYNPDTVTAEGINYFTQAQIKISPFPNLALAKDRAVTAISQDKFDAQHYFLLARVKRMQGDIAGAFSSYRQAISLDPLNSPEYYLDLANLQQAHNQPEAALKNATTAINLYPPKVIQNRNAVTDLPQIVASLYKVKAEAELKLKQP